MSVGWDARLPRQTHNIRRDIYYTMPTFPIQCVEIRIVWENNWTFYIKRVQMPIKETRQITKLFFIHHIIIYLLSIHLYVLLRILYSDVSGYPVYKPLFNCFQRCLEGTDGIQGQSTVFISAFIYYECRRAFYIFPFPKKRFRILSLHNVGN